MTHASLFSGIGGAELAATWMGWDNAFHCEINPFGRKVIEYWYPNSKSYEDITTTDFTVWRGKVDVLTGGFPCQPFSVAGSRKGAEDNRYLWPQMLRAIREIQPTWIVGENVAGILTMVQPGSDVEMGSGSALFDESHLYRMEQEFVIETVCKDIESAGYSVQPVVIPACAVGAPHRRDRVWFVAQREYGVTPDSDSDRCRQRKDEQEPVAGFKESPDHCDGSKDGITPDAESARSERECKRKQGKEKFNRRNCEDIQARFGDFPTQSPVCDRDDGIPAGLVGITFPRWRAEAVKALGNAWVPQVAFEIFKVIEIHENRNFSS